MSEFEYVDYGSIDNDRIIEWIVQQKEIGVHQIGRNGLHVQAARILLLHQMQRLSPKTVT